MHTEKARKEAQAAVKELTKAGVLPEIKNKQKTRDTADGLGGAFFEEEDVGAGD